MAKKKLSAGHWTGIFLSLLPIIQSVSSAVGWDFTLPTADAVVTTISTIAGFFGITILVKSPAPKEASK